MRNARWFVPAGCFTLLLIAAAFVAGFVALIFAGMKSGEVYRTAVAKAHADPRTLKALGSPLKEGFFVTGTEHASPAAGQADIAIPISGPKGKGSLHAVATKSAGQWHFNSIVLVVAKTGERIDFLEPPSG